MKAAPTASVMRGIPLGEASVDPVRQAPLSCNDFGRPYR